MTVYVVGTGNCGTRFLTDVLNNGGVHAVHEPRHLHQNAVAYAYGKAVPDQVRNAIKHLRIQANPDVVIDWASTLTMDFIREVDDDAEIVLLHRQGDECVRSRMSDWKRRVDNAWVPETTRVPPYGYWPGPAFVKACRWWSEMNRLAWPEYPSGQPGPANHRLAFTGVTRPTPDGLKTLRSVFGPPDGGSWELVIEDTDPVGGTDHTFPAYEAWPTELKTTFWHLCGDMMGALGYADGYERPWEAVR